MGYLADARPVSASRRQGGDHMFFSNLAYTGLGLVVLTGRAAKDAFNTLSKRGEEVRHDNETVAGRFDRFVVHDVPVAIGHGLGMAVDGAVRAVEYAKQVAANGQKLSDGPIESVLQRLGLPSNADLADIRARLDQLSQQLDRITTGVREAPAWEEKDDTAAEP
jgi:hypothetical protein